MNKVLSAWIIFQLLMIGYIQGVIQTSECIEISTSKSNGFGMMVTTMILPLVNFIPPENMNFSKECESND